MAAETEIQHIGPVGRVRGFVDGLKTELRQVIWPGWEQVWQTGVVVIFTVVFFGSFLYFADMIMHFLLSHLVEIPLQSWMGRA